MLSTVGQKTVAYAIATTFVLSLSPADAQSAFHAAPALVNQRIVSNARKPDAYIYVSDANNEKVYVYPAGVVNPAPLNELIISGVPTGMSTAADGNLYVAVSNISQGDSISIYSAGGKRLLGSIGAANGVGSIRDVAFDSSGNLYVSCVRTTDATNGVAEFAKNSTQIVGWYPSPTSQNYGITIDAQDNLYLDTGLYGMALEYTKASPNAYTVAGVFGAPTAGGLSFSGTSLVMSGGTGLFIFTPSPPGSKYPYTRTSFIDFGVGHGTGYLTRGSDGTLYVPVYGNSGGHSAVHEVRMYRENANRPEQFSEYASISQGLEYPDGVATGPK